MDFSKSRLSIDEARKIDMVDYLFKLGFEPSKISNNDYWYLSPLRMERTPSFKVNRKLNRWYDHGMGRGGNLVDFGIEYHQCTISELIEKLGSNFSFQQSPMQPVPVEYTPEHKIKVLSDFPITSYSLLHYLEQRRIAVNVADQCCREVRYELNDKTYYGIGFKNDSGGFEIRNPYFKTSSSPKDITTFMNGSDEAIIFEGFIDFLSYKTLYKDLPENSCDFVVLNSVSFFERARPFMEKHNSIRLYLDKDATGQSLTQRALLMSSKYTDQSALYNGYKDLNDWLVNAGKPQKRRMKIRV
ncbi:toprim domain-containing protein [Emticicia sp. TH156]|uniref:toprim domain-containing protein n=1 Tax=Emticicia sp. TH156 TaxID=2067454 RepID=UPI000C7784E4|nr:toprim domain-containing protein [Emticicia sp. TH156]PLK44915.1 DNA primase [Emticicia sp. TH156]